ncbi:MAG: HNH endonuclease [Microbacterium sp.]|nr:HNH endonuclease [Microbacterium sp.]
MPHHAEKLSETEYRDLLALVCPPGSICWLCRRPVIYGLRAWHPWGPSLDHVVPASKGGTWDPSNLRPAHYGCNAGRRDRAPRVPRGTRSSRWANVGKRNAQRDDTDS